MIRILAFTAGFVVELLSPFPPKKQANFIDWLCWSRPMEAQRYEWN